LVGGYWGIVGKKNPDEIVIQWGNYRWKILVSCLIEGLGVGGGGGDTMESMLLLI